VAALLLALPATWPLWRTGFFVSDDGRFHVYRIAALADAWQQGVLYPRLFPEFGFGYGQAVLNYYAPGAYVPGAALSTLGMSPASAAEWTLALGLVLAALTAYGFGQAFWGPLGGVLAAVAYTYFPYHLADAYLRGALAEQLAFVWLPLVLWLTATGFAGRTPRRAFLLAALGWAGLAYTHNLTLMLLAPAWAAFAVVMAAWTGRWRRMAGAAASAALGAGLSAPLWLPFLVQRSWVGLGAGASDGYRSHLGNLTQLVQTRLLYQYRADPQLAMEHQLSWLVVAVTLGAAALLLRRLATHRETATAPAIAYALGLVAVSAFMVTVSAQPIWTSMQGVLAQLQYPWRFMTLAALGFAGVAGSYVSLLADLSRRVVLAAAAIVVALLILQPLILVSHQRLDLPAADAWSPERMWREDAEAGQVGATWTGEFVPVSVREQRWALGRPREAAGHSDGAPRAASPEVTIRELRYLGATLSLRGWEGEEARLHQFHLPAWRVTAGGEALPTYASGDLGLVSTKAPDEPGDVRFGFGPTGVWTAAYLLALAAAIAWLAAAWRAPGAGPLMRAGGVAVVVAAGMLLLNSLGIGERSRSPLPLAASVGDAALLVAYEHSPARESDALDVTLYWFGLSETVANNKVFVHLLDGSGTVVAQHDGDPGGGFTPTSRWMRGELVPDRHRLYLPPSLPPGDYTLKAGMYAATPGEGAGFRNLPVEPATADGRIPLGQVQLGSPASGVAD
jgi:hypothetical protein